MILGSLLRFGKNILLRRREYLTGFKKRFLSFGEGTRVEHPSNIPDAKFVSIGKNTTILSDSRIQVFNVLTGQEAKVTIGDNCYFGFHLSVLAGGSINIGNEVLIASNVLITSEDHGMNPELETPYMDQPLSCKPVEIGDGTWIGEKVSILPGVTIGKKCVIGTNAVVTKDVPDYCMAVGIPAKVIKKWDFDQHCWMPFKLEGK